MGVKTILRASRLAATPAMTDDNRLSFNLPSVSRKKVTAVFDGGRLSSDSGVMLLALADRRRAVADPQRCGERDRPQGRGEPDRRQGRWRFHQHVNFVCLQYLHVAYQWYGILLR